jgi:hypothetical protein
MAWSPCKPFWPGRPSYQSCKLDSRRGSRRRNKETKITLASPLYYISKLLIMAACALSASVVAKRSDRRSLRSSTSLCKFLI